MEISQTPENALSASSVSAVINAPIEKIDISSWLLNLPDKEYQRCSVNHIAAGITSDFEGTPMSINVEYGQCTCHSTLCYDRIQTRLLQNVVHLRHHYCKWKIQSSGTLGIKS